MRYLKSSLIHRALPIVLGVIFLKACAHYFNLEILTINPLFSGLLAANVFLMGFLMQGVLSDYKESEKLPGELAVSLLAMRDEMAIILRNKQAPEARLGIAHLTAFAQTLNAWFYKKARTDELTALLQEFNGHFLAFESLTQATFIARLKLEQTTLRRILTRIHTIRETDFVKSGYLIAEATTILFTIGLIFSKIDPFHESLFFVFVICFFLNYLLLLIRSLDNPFGYYEKGGFENVSLKPLEDALNELQNTREQEQIPLPSP